VDFGGSLKGGKFKSGKTLTRVEVGFSQQIEDVTEQGNAIAEVTVDSLKYHSEVKGDVQLDFDSSRQADKNDPMAAIIGTTYKIEIAPNGDVVDVVDTSDAQAALKGSKYSRVRSLVSKKAILERHAVGVLPAEKAAEIQPGENWSNIEDFTFGSMMGAEQYERIYTLKEVKDTPRGKTAVIEMTAIPSSEGAAETYQQQGGSPFSKIFDTQQSFTGQMLINLDKNAILKSLQELEVNWTAVDPSTQEGENGEPDMLRMTARRYNSLEKVD
jgi:hypothetical protein